MNQLLSGLVSRIQTKFPQLDIRTDQCDIVRVLRKDALIAIYQKDTFLQVDVLSLKDESDFETPLMRTFSSSDFVEFEREVLSIIMETD